MEIEKIQEQLITKIDNSYEYITDATSNILEQLIDLRCYFAEITYLKKLLNNFPQKTD